MRLLRPLLRPRTRHLWLATLLLLTAILLAACTSQAAPPADEEIAAEENDLNAAAPEATSEEEKGDGEMDEGDEATATPTTEADDASGATPTGTTMEEMGDNGQMDETGEMMATGMLGGSAETESLALAQLETLPDPPLAWQAFTVGGGGLGDDMMAAGLDAPVSHSHAPAFVYSPEGLHTVVLDGDKRTLAMGEAIFIGAGVTHTHRADGSFWEILLAPPESVAPEGLEMAKPLFASPPMAELPEGPADLHFVLVEMPPTSETAIHTHPGPEYIVVTEGDIQYQNAVVGTIMLQAGEDHFLPPDTAVQKRNVDMMDAAFLSWFILDPEAPFASEAAFE